MLSRFIQIRQYNMYYRYLKKYPFLSQSMQAFAVVGLGDVFAQFAIEKKTSEEYNFLRSMELGLAGFLFAAPLQTYWYQFLQRKFGSGNFMVAVKKMVIDQTCASAPCNFLFLCGLGVIQRKYPHEIKEGIKNTFATIIFTNWKIWPFVQLINFGFVPLHFQVLFVSVVAVFWSSFISFTVHKDIRQQADKSAGKTGNKAAAKPVNKSDKKQS